MNAAANDNHFADITRAGWKLIAEQEHFLRVYRAGGIITWGNHTATYIAAARKALDAGMKPYAAHAHAEEIEAGAMRIARQKRERAAK